MLSTAGRFIGRGLRHTGRTTLAQKVSARHLSAFKDGIDGHTAERLQEGIVPKPLDASETSALCDLLTKPPAGEEEFLLHQLTNRVPPGVDEAAYVKASYLTSVAKGEVASPIVSKLHAVELLSTMQGGYNISTLVELLDDADLGGAAADGLCTTLLMFEAFFDVEAKAQAGNANAKRVMQVSVYVYMYMYIVCVSLSLSPSSSTSTSIPFLLTSNTCTFTNTHTRRAGPTPSGSRAAPRFRKRSQ